MATMHDVMEGIKIILQYASDDEIFGHNFQAEHDQIWCGNYTGNKMSKDDLGKMNELGWFEDEEAWSKLT